MVWVMPPGVEAEGGKAGGERAEGAEKTQGAEGAEVTEGAEKTEVAAVAEGAEAQGAAVEVEVLMADVAEAEAASHAADCRPGTRDGLLLTHMHSAPP